ncbi:hypothetical protein N7508_000139 [Penicillium antarcticum]|nr:uncharacterized protein N7508_000139 [Penicillium antarcticum]KAJ5319856.1 hypothetical protein N7508_000139 [Penicillium antarcticum]
MAAYPNVAENGASAYQGSGKIYPCSGAIEGLQPADGLIFVPTMVSTMALLSLNPAIIDELSGSKLNQSLNLFEPANGFVNKSLSNCTTEFKKNF